METASLKISVALIMTSLLAVAGAALSLVDRLRGQYSGQRSACGSAPVDCAFLGRFRSLGGEAGNCWENVDDERY